MLLPVDTSLSSGYLQPSEPQLTAGMRRLHEELKPDHMIQKKLPPVDQKLPRSSCLNSSHALAPKTNERRDLEAYESGAGISEVSNLANQPCAP